MGKESRRTRQLNARVAIAVFWFWGSLVSLYFLLAGLLLPDLVAVAGGASNAPESYSTEYDVADAFSGCAVLLIMGALPAMACGVYGYMLAAVMRVEAEFTGSPPRCWRCNYLLIGLDVARCPECGAPEDAEASLRKAKRRAIYAEAARLAVASVTALVATIMCCVVFPAAGLAVGLGFVVWWTSLRLMVSGRRRVMVGSCRSAGHTRMGTPAS